MKTLLVLLTLLPVHAQATSDGIDSAWIVTNVQGDGDTYRIVSAPYVACFGDPITPRLQAFTAEFNVPSVSGSCGGEGNNTSANINILTCAKVVSSEPNNAYDGLKSLEIDISACHDKDQPAFEMAVRQAATKNFKAKNEKLSLEIKK